MLLLCLHLGAMLYIKSEPDDWAVPSSGLFEAHFIPATGYALVESPRLVSNDLSASAPPVPETKDIDLHAVDIEAAMKNRADSCPAGGVPLPASGNGEHGPTQRKVYCP